MAAPAPDDVDANKKKKTRQLATDFAKELDEMDAENDDDAGVDVDGDLGDDLFEKTNGVDGSGETGKEAWILEGRDPTYPEVGYTSNGSRAHGFSC